MSPAGPDWMTDLDSLAEELFAHPPASSPRWPSKPKTIHDAVWGSRLFADWEMAIIDLPVMQRLRNVRQLSMAFLVYPTAQHTRFEHSLGVASIAKDMLRETGLQETSENEDDPGGSWYRTTVAAALLHDIGHGPFSHLSEEVYYLQGDWLGGLTQGSDPLYPEAQPHEALGALLLQTSAARRFFNALEERYGVHFDPVTIGDFITGRPVADSGAYAAIVNGATDADKVDYLRRDAFFTGIPLSLDVNRLLYALETVEDTRGLIVGSKGVVPAEQITFAKATLTSALYHHKKVRASDCAFKGVAERMIKEGRAFGGRMITNPAQMLWLTDADFLASSSKAEDEITNSLLRMVRQRELPVSAKTLRFSEVDSDSSREDKFASLRALRHRPAGRGEQHHVHARLRALAAELRTAIGDTSVLHERIWIDLPPKPKIGGVQVSLDGGHVSTFPSSEWTRLYSQYKYVGHVFVPPEAKDSAQAVVDQVVMPGFGELAGMRLI